jgi:osmotically inducible protein OsmC
MVVVGTFDVSWPSRTEAPNGKTSPEELIAAAHAACFNMSLSFCLSRAGTPPQALDTSAEVTLELDKGITGIQLTVRGSADGATAENFVGAAEEAKANCPVSQALAGPTITLDAALA